MDLEVFLVDLDTATLMQLCCPKRALKPQYCIYFQTTPKIVYRSIEAVYVLNRPPGYKLAAPGALARAKVKLYHGKARRHVGAIIHTLWLRRRVRPQ